MLRSCPGESRLVIRDLLRSRLYGRRLVDDMSREKETIPLKKPEISSPWKKCTSIGRFTGHLYWRVVPFLLGIIGPGSQGETDRRHTFDFDQSRYRRRNRKPRVTVRPCVLSAPYSSKCTSCSSSRHIASRRSLLLVYHLDFLFLFRVRLPLVRPGRVSSHLLDRVTVPQISTPISAKRWLCRGPA